MPRSSDRRAPGWLGLLGVLATSLGALGCPGTLDPSLLDGGSSAGAAGSTGAGGSGAGGSGGTSSCNQDLAVTTNCASANCHDSITKEAGLDLTPGAGVTARLVGVKSMGGGDSQCGGNTEAYLNANSNPATGLMIDKMTIRNPPCGSLMPFGAATPLPAATLACLEQWAEAVVMGTSQ
jgi:hypothetical protein